MADYDKYYKTEDLFGEPYPELIDFFAKYGQKSNLLDLGCGQGRDSISLARLGYRVTGMDLSIIGIEQMIKISRAENLKITGIVSDIYKFDGYKNYDIILLYSMLHFEKKELAKETGLVINIAKQMKTEGILCICIRDSGKKVKILKQTILDTGVDFDILNDSLLTYKYEDKKTGHKSMTNYCLYILKKRLSTKA